MIFWFYNITVQHKYYIRFQWILKTKHIYICCRLFRSFLNLFVISALLCVGYNMTEIHVHQYGVFQIKQLLLHLCTLRIYFTKG